MTEFKFQVQTSNRGQLNIPLVEGKALFVLGANGVGKSTLMQKLFNQNFNHSKRILAHRQTWFTNNSMDMTASQKKQTETNMRSNDNQTYSRWKDDYSQARSSISIFDLINSENIRARKIAGAVDTDKMDLAKQLSNTQAPLQSINELLAFSNIPISITLGRDDQLFASKNGSPLYSIAELSDGERNALLICADVLTTDPDYLIILDEPERHLHRSIISPLLSSLFQKRKDCVFVISTHDVHLPIDHSEASVLLLRGCQWNGDIIKDWDADLMTETDQIPNAIKRDILGAKRNILFVEGQSQSLDRQIYQLLYPQVSVIPQGNCLQVERAVDGVRQTEVLHWINAFGLIDSDDRTPEQIVALLAKGIVAIECYSVEALYYDLEIVKRVAKRYASVSGVNEAELYQRATADILKNIKAHKERLCSRLCEKQVRNTLMSNLPTHKDIAAKGIFEQKLDLKDTMTKEEALFEKMVSANNLTGLIRRYPLRETPVLSQMASGLGLTRDKYEGAVRKLLVDDGDSKQYLRSILEKLTKLVED